MKERVMKKSYLAKGLIIIALIPFAVMFFYIYVRLFIYIQALTLILMVLIVLIGLCLQGVILVVS